MSANIKVFPIAKTAVDYEEMEKWLKEIGAEEFYKEGDPPSDSEYICGVAAVNCYKAFGIGLNPNVEKIREDWNSYFENLLQSKHGSVLEHATWTWAIENCSRVFTGEMNRHRAGVAISERSMRYYRYDNGIPYWFPASMEIAGKDTKEMRGKKERTKEIFEEVFGFVQAKYNELLHVWDRELQGKFSTKKQLTSVFRRLIPMGVATGGIWTFNLRALRHVLTMRCNPAAEEEICYICGLIAKTMIEECGYAFGDFYCENGFWKPKYEKV